MEFKDGLAAQAVLCGDGCHQRIDHPLQFFDRAAVDAQFGCGAIGIDGILVGVQEGSDAVFNDAHAFGPLHDLDHRALEEIAHTVDQRVVIHDIGDLRRRHGQAYHNLDFLRLVQIWRARETDDGIDGLVGRPAVDYSTELDLIADRVVYFVDKDRKRWQLSDEVTQLIGLAISFVLAVLEEADLPLLLLDSVKDDLFCIGDRYQAEQLVQRLVVSDFLNIGILGFVGFVGCLALIQHFK